MKDQDKIITLTIRPVDNAAQSALDQMREFAQEMEETIALRSQDENYRKLCAQLRKLSKDFRRLARSIERFMSDDEDR